MVVSAKYDALVHEVSHCLDEGSANSPAIQLGTHYFLVLSPKVKGESGQTGTQV